MRTPRLTNFWRNLTAALLVGPWTAEDLRERAGRACRGDRRVLPGLLRRLGKRFGEAAPAEGVLFEFLCGDVRLQRAWRDRRLEVGELFWLPARMMPRGEAAARWAVPEITTAGQLADWLGVTVPRLDWLADLRGTTPDGEERLRHYVTLWRQRRRGRPRLVEAPKSMLKAIQRRILDEILEKIPAHESAHGFRKGRSIVTYAAPHVGQRIVLRFDLRDFFASITAARVRAIFVTAGYPITVARLVTALCTTRIGEDAWERCPGEAPDQRTRDRFRRRHLPQGAPTSPALANLCAYRMDVRLEALARSVGARYTRYADDLAFSDGEELERTARRFQVGVAVIAGEEGFELHTRKSRFMRAGVRQHLASVVVNVKPNVRRDAFDLLKAILYNCVRHGPASQNRKGHADFEGQLRGRVAHVAMVNGRRGEKLRELLERIEWGDPWKSAAANRGPESPR